MTMLNPVGYTARECFENAFDQEKAAAIGLAAGPNIKYVRTHQRAAWSLRIVAEFLKNRWRHKKGGEYYEIGRGELQLADYESASEGDILVAYVGKDGRMWFRREGEFEPERGRFVKVVDPTPTKES